MKTLEELKEKFDKLNKERSILFKKICELENQETLKEFTVGNCYLESIQTEHLEYYLMIKMEN